MAIPDGDAPTPVAHLWTLAERSLRRASGSLTEMLGRPVHLTVSDIRALPPSGLAGLAADVGCGPMAGLRLQILGQGDGCILILLPVGTVYRLLDVVMGTPATRHSLGEVERSAIQEVANVLASSFLSELGDALDRRLLPSAPEMHLERVPRMVRDALEPIRALDDEVLVVRAALEDSERQIAGRFLAVLGIGTLTGC
jgi:chemotaxis protein CheC